ncbi:methylmalonyl-CoA carboxyltransferase [Deltaproteobacteria bacterium]|nr:methylmalonyl-CoA carboxyltransferase [Deltaproteobacteria bacterium]
MTIVAKINEFMAKASRLFLGGGEPSIERQKKNGKMTVRERLDLILDSNSFFEIDLFVEHSVSDFGMEGKELAGDGVVTGFGKVDGRSIAVFAQDFTVAGGSLGKAHAGKIVKIMDSAGEMGMPLIGVNDSGGARIQEGVDALCGYGDIFFRNTQLSGVVPQISVILGPCAGGAVYSPALTDFVFVVDRISNMFITGPQVIKSVLSEEIGAEELGGAKTHASITGNAQFFAETEEEAFLQIRKLLSFLPSNCNEDPPIEDHPKPPKTPLDTVDALPEDRKKSYNVKGIIKGIVDDSDFFEVQERFAGNIVVGFGRIDGRPIGIIANQPRFLAGVLNVDGSDKTARFIRFCDAFNIPLLTLVDTPGYLPGIDQEHSGIIRHGAKLLYAYSEATVPKFTVVLRKAYGGAYVAMCSKHLGANLVMAWPTAEIAVMGPEGATNIIFRKEIASSDDPEGTREKLVKEYEEKFANPYVAASRGYVDLIIKPHETREALITALGITKTRKTRLYKRYHGNMPL